MGETKLPRTTSLGVALASFATLAACAGDEGQGVPGDSGDTQPFSQITAEHTLRLTGTEPFWAGEVSGDALIWSTPDIPDGVEIAVSRFPGRGGIAFNGALDGEPLDILVTPAECSDGMSDRTYPYVATVQIGTSQREGCAWREGIDSVGAP